MVTEIKIPTVLLVGMLGTLLDIEQALEDGRPLQPNTAEEVSNLASAINCALIENDSHPDQ